MCVCVCVCCRPEETEEDIIKKNEAEKELEAEQKKFLKDDNKLGLLTLLTISANPRRCHLQQAPLLGSWYRS